MVDDDKVVVVLPGTPVGFAHRSTADGRRRYLPPRQRDFAAALRLAAGAAMNGRPPFDDPVCLDLRVETPIPRTWSKKKTRSAVLGEILPGTRPDLTNVLKICEDACNGILFRDDSLICKQQVCKRYSLTPQIVLTVGLLRYRQQEPCQIGVQRIRCRPLSAE